MSLLFSGLGKGRVQRCRAPPDHHRLRLTLTSLAGCGLWCPWGAGETVVPESGDSTSTPRSAIRLRENLGRVLRFISLGLRLFTCRMRSLHGVKDPGQLSHRSPHRIVIPGASHTASHTHKLQNGHRPFTDNCISQLSASSLFT